jgi:hypothetical protein
VVGKAQRGEREDRGRHECQGPDRPHEHERVGGRERQGGRPELPGVGLVGPQGGDPAGAGSGDDAGHGVRRERRHRDPDEQRQAHGLQHRGRCPGVLGQERQHDEHEGDQRQAERDGGAGLGALGGVVGRQGDQAPQQRPVGDHQQQRGERDGPPLALRGQRLGAGRDDQPEQPHPFTAPAVRPRTK